MNEEIVTCPKCGSEEVAPLKKGGWLFLLTSLLFLYPTPFLQKRYHCFDCKCEFKFNKNKQNAI
jgi:DNA-directed RNA polymerase subunit RPC12/RpoP